MRKDYGPIVRTARRLIRRFGKPVHIVKGQPPSAGWNPSSAGPADYIKVMFVEVGYSLTNRSGELVQAGDRIGIVEATQYDIQPNDILNVGGQMHTIIDVQPISPGPTKVITEIIARR